VHVCNLHVLPRRRITIQKIQVLSTSSYMLAVVILAVGLPRTRLAIFNIFDAVGSWAFCYVIKQRAVGFDFEGYSGEKKFRYSCIPDIFTGSKIHLNFHVLSTRNSVVLLATTRLPNPERCAQCRFSVRVCSCMGHMTTNAFFLVHLVDNCN
jgi:hypothetical protein